MTTADANTTPGQSQEYPWLLAPAHLKTRRQLRAAGLQPNRQPVAALMVGKRRGRRLVAHLYDLAKAAPKKPPTAAQLAAAEAATREHQARAAVRHGISRSDLAADVEPADGLGHPSRYHRSEGETTCPTPPPQEIQPQLGIATGHNQRIALLLATVACNRAKARDEELFRTVEAAQRAGEDSVEQLYLDTQREIEAAEARAERVQGDDKVAVFDALTDALQWREQSELLADQLTELSDHITLTWGVSIDRDELTAGIDPEFDPVELQDLAEAYCLDMREAAVVDIVSAMPLPEASKAQVLEAVSAWHRGIDQDDLPGYLDGTQARRERLGQALAAAKLSESDRAAVEFAVDYLRGDMSRIDMLAAPVVVDPGEEARGRMRDLLATYAADPATAPQVGQAIAVMSAADQRTVQDIGKAIRAGQQPDLAVWPGYVDRQDLTDQLAIYAEDTVDLRTDADFLAEDRYSNEERSCLGQGGAGFTDELSERLTRLSATRAQLLDHARTGQGLASMERAQIAATVADIDAGRILSGKQLPELMWADERSRAAVDADRVREKAAMLATATTEALAQRLDATDIEAAGPVRDRLNLDIAAIGTSLHNVGSATPAATLEERRRDFVQRRGRLEQDLTQAGVQVAARAEIRGLVDARGKEAGQLGQTATGRREQWHTRTAQAVAAREKTAARRAAVDAGDPNPAERACTTRPTRAAGQATSTRRGARIAQLHTQEVGR